MALLNKNKKKKNRTVRVPKLLEPLIELQNLLPQNTIYLDRPKYNSDLKSVMHELYDDDYPSLTMEERKEQAIFEIRLSLWERIWMLPDLFQQYIWQGNAPCVSPEEEILQKNFDLFTVSTETL